MTKIKICGLTRTQDICFVNRYKPEYIGFVFAQKSKRYVAPEQAKQLAAGLEPGIQSVGVFTQISAIEIAQIATSVPLNVVQLHGMQTENMVRELRHLLPEEIRLWYCVAAKEGSIYFPPLHDMVDLWLVDTASDGSFGGTGKTFDWEKAKEFLQDRKIILAGGLSPENAVQAVQCLQPYCVDVSSGVETDGVKDEEKIRRFITTIRNESRE